MMPQMEIIIRRAAGSDAQAVAACVDAAYRPYIELLGKPPGPMLNDYNAVVRNHQAFAAECRGQVVGVLVLVPQPDDMLLDNIAVHPDYQGQGVGRQLMILAEKEAMGQGFDHIELYTHELMVKNIELYQKVGYVEFDRRTEKGYKRVFLRKPLRKNID